MNEDLARLPEDLREKAKADMPILVEAKRRARTKSALLATILIYADGDIRLRPEL